MKKQFYIVLAIGIFIASQLTGQVAVSASSINIIDSLSNTTVYQDEKYGNHDRQAFDILVSDNCTDCPLVIFIHGGGFRNGDKQQAYEKYFDGIKKLVSKDIAFATINYRFLEHSENGVMTSLEDGKSCLQYIRFHAEKYKINPDSIIAFGESAGAGMSLWLGLSDDMKDLSTDNPLEQMSTKLTAVGAFSTQSTYDILRWQEVFEEWDVTFDGLPIAFKQPIINFYGAETYEELQSKKYQDYRAQLDFFSLMTADDPPIWVRNNASDGHPLFFDSQHHPLHAKYLKKYADKAGVKNLVYAPALNIMEEEEETLMDFILEILQRNNS